VSRRCLLAALLGALALAAGAYFFVVFKRPPASPPRCAVAPLDMEFLEACRRGDLAAARKCLRAGADVLARSAYRSGLVAAIDGGSLEVARFLLSREKKLASLADDHGLLPLGYVVRGHGGYAAAHPCAERLALLEALVAAGAGVDEVDGYGYGMSDIFFASGPCAPGMVGFLVSRGARVNRRSTATYEDSFCDNDFTLPAGSTPLDRYEALLEVIPADPDFARFRETIGEVIRVLRGRGAVNGAWAGQERRRGTT
jgi:hypothetical protein